MEPFIGEIRLFGGNFAPVGWAFCDGSLLTISEYETLYTLIGTTYGGDGQTNFAVPDLRGRLPVHVGTQQGNTLALGQTTGSETVTLNSTQMPVHGHALQASSQTAPPGGGVTAGALLAQPEAGELYAGTGRRPKTLSPQTIGVSGGSQPHSNQSPYLCVNFIISLFGIYPSQG
ncbi:phage tail protein [Deinococcus sp. HMF7620]|uniref:Phage tail protein n=1 Tax=Deinococcus arboris TaxID=2682977 RepID=A0A7C9I2B9_9DEIO|nr:phage tail protein [Deinococcus arboris]